MLIAALQSVILMGGSFFFQKQGIIKNKIGFPLKPDDVIMMSSNMERLTKVHFMISILYSTDHQNLKNQAAFYTIYLTGGVPTPIYFL